MTAPQTTYDEVMYNSYPFVETHPDRLATVAHLFGLTPPDGRTARILEMGCAGGGNIIPIAEQLPDTKIIGVDLSGKQIAAGQERIKRLGLKNIELRHGSIMDINESWGQFDYIITHGIFSWVPNEVQEKILSVSKANLQPNGIAYISYNTLPGWHMRGMIRDMMRYHANRFGDPATRIGQARALLEFLHQAVGNQPDNPYSSLLKLETQMLKQAEDWYLYHEHLEEINMPIYFYQFVEMAQKHGLRFLGESNIRKMVPGNYPKEVEEVLQRLSNDVIHMEQYMDFLRNGMFRQSLLCHPNHQPNYSVSPDRLNGLFVATALAPAEAQPDLLTMKQEKFQLPNSAGSVQVTDPLCKNALMMLHEAWPQGIRFEELCDGARKRLDPLLTPDSIIQSRDRSTLGRMVLQFQMSIVDRLIELRPRQISVMKTPSEKPMTSGYARIEAETNRMATNQKHELGTIGEFERHILRFLDGKHDRAALLDEMFKLVRGGVLQANENNQPVTDEKRVRELLAPSIDDALRRFGQHAFLIA